VLFYNKYLIKTTENKLNLFFCKFLLILDGFKLINNLNGYKYLAEVVRYFFFL